MKTTFLIPVLILFYSFFCHAQLTYQSPDPQVSVLVDSAGFSYPSMNPQYTEFVKYRIQATPSIDYLSRPQLRLAGLRFSPNNLAPFSGRYRSDLRYYDQKLKKDRAISFAAMSYVRSFVWSPDGKSLAVQVEAPSCVEVWIVKVPSLQKNLVPGVCLNTALDGDGSFHWVDSKKIIFLQRKAKMPLHALAAVPGGPAVIESQGKVSQNRTFQDLLRNPADAEIFEKAIESQITEVDVTTMKSRPIGKPGPYVVADLSPNNKWILTAQVKKPYSYVVPLSLFKRERSLISRDGKIRKIIGEVGPFENLPIQGVPTGPRNLSWDSSRPQSLIYVEAQDQGDWKVKVPFRDFLYSAEVGATGDLSVKKIAALENRFQGITELEDSGLGAIIYDYDRDSKLVRYYHLTVDGQSSQLKEFLRINSDDDYANPGEIILGRNKFNHYVGRVQRAEDGNFVYWRGDGATPNGERPFIKKLNLQSLKFTEVYRSSESVYEQMWGLYPGEFSRVIMRVESPTEAPHFVTKTLQDLTAPGVPLFLEPNPYQVMTGVKKTLLRYKRKDGVELSGILYYPLNYNPGTKYPCVVHAYPLEYTDPKVAGQTRGATTRFEAPFRATPLYFLMRGYFVLDDAQIPIVGPPETKNDTFIEQLTMDADATVQALASTGLIDIRRLGIVGHSYGAFMVANLLTYTPYFAAGIARSGAYNRTLTPFGFQGEHRPLWEAKSTYLKMSPFLDADKMKKPLLLIHGADDNNPGTLTLQSQRYFDALKGQGAIARLVLLPSESHDYSARESVKHVLWESFQWFDQHLSEAH